MQADFSCYKEKFEKSKSAESLCSSDPVIKAHSDLVEWISYCRDSLDNVVGSDKPGFEKYHYKIWHNLNILVMEVEQVMKGNLIVEFGFTMAALGRAVRNHKLPAWRKEL